MGEGSYKTFGERNWYDNAAVPTAAILSDPNPSFTKKARRSNSLPGFAPGSAPRSADVFFFSSAILYLELYLGLCLELLPPTFPRLFPPDLLGASSRNWRFWSEGSIDGFHRNQSRGLGGNQIV